MRIHPGDGAGRFIGPMRSPESGILDCGDHQTADGADFDLDGDLDLVTGLKGNDECTTQIRVRENTGNGTFDIGTEISLAPPDGAWVDQTAVADLDGDGRPDIVAADSGPFDLVIDFPGAIWTILATGGLDFAEPVKLPLETDPWHLAIADFDADGDPDVAAHTSATHPGNGVDPVPRHVEILLNDGDGNLTHAQQITLDAEYPTEFHAGVVEAADLDGDGDADLLATVGSKLESGRIVTLLNDGSGSFTVASDEVVGWQPSSIALRDVDLDGDVDAAVMFHHGNSTQEAKFEPYLKIFHNDGAGELSLAQELLDVSVINKWSMKSADFNQDGYPDLSLAADWGSVLVHLNLGDGTFGEGVGYDLLDKVGVQAQAIADFDMDGDPDIVAAASIIDGMIMMLSNESCPPCPADVNADGELSILDFVAFQLLWQDQDPKADCDANGAFDVLDFVCFQQLFQAGCP